MNGGTAATGENGEHVTIVLEGEIDLANHDHVERQIYDAVTNHAQVVTIDLSAVEYVDSAGLRVLFNLSSRLDLLQIRMELIAPVGSAARRVIEVSGLARVVTVLP